MTLLSAAGSPVPPPHRWPDRLAWVTLATTAMISAATFRDYGLGWDDFTHSQYGDLLLSFYASGLRDTRALSFVNLYYYGGGFDMAATLAAKFLPFDLFETRRLMGASVGLIGLFATWRIGRRAGGSLAGFIALILCVTCPLYYGHMFFNPKDAPFAAFMAVFLLGFVRMIDEHPKPRIATIAILGAGFGLAIGSRILAGFGAIAAIAAIALLFIAETRRYGGAIASQRLGRLALTLIPAAVLAYAVMTLIWPWSAVDPLNPFRAVEYFSHFFEKPWQELFGGERLTPPEMPRSYVLVLLALKLPEIFLLLGICGALAAIITACFSSRSPQSRALLLSIGLAALLPIAVSVATRPAMYNGIRHFVFIVPPLAVAGGIAGAWLAERAASYGRAAFFGLALIFTAGVFLPAIDMVRLHPYQYASFNRLIGGVRGAQPLYMLDYWGLALKQAAAGMLQTLDAHGAIKPTERKWKVAVCGPHPPAQWALGDDFEPTWDPVGADFALMLGAFYCAQLKAPILAEVMRDGVLFARAYDIRRLAITEIFTVPPVR